MVSDELKAEFRCCDCGRLFGSKIGLGQHRRLAHPVANNRDKLLCMNFAGSRWSLQESASLFRIANNLAGTCQSQVELYKALQPYFPGRSTSSIKTRLLSLRKNRVPCASAADCQIISHEPLTPLLETAEEYTARSSKFLDTIISQLESNEKPRLLSCDLLFFANGLKSESFTRAQVLSLLNVHAMNAFPHTWSMVSKRRARNAVRTYTNGKQIRRANYAALQTTYHHRRKDAATAVLNGSWRDGYKVNRGLPVNSDMYWHDILSIAPHADKRPCRQVIPCDWSLIDPITGVEVKSALKRVGNTAAGLDRLLPKDLEKMNAKALAAYFNFLLLAEGCPSHLCRSRITLTPKIHEPVSPSELRPISVSFVLIRCFHKVLASRWNGFLKLPSLQFAFLQRDGGLEATSLLYALLRHSNCTLSGLALDFIVVSKAFNSISHDTIIRSAAAFGAPPSVLSYLAESYKQAVAQFPNLKAKCQRGVKQADSLSPLLFIMAMDEVLALALPELGCQFHGTLVNGFAYADDLILIVENVTRPKEKLAAAYDSTSRCWDDHQ